MGNFLRPQRPHLGRHRETRGLGAVDSDARGVQPADAALLTKKAVPLESGLLPEEVQVGRRGSGIIDSQLELEWHPNLPGSSDRPGGSRSLSGGSRPLDGCQ